MAITRRYEQSSIAENIRIFKNAIWVLKKDYKFRDVGDDGESVLIDSMYGNKQRFGYTDYRDHRYDTLSQIKDLITESASKTTHQRIHLYKDVECKIPYKKIVCWGYYGGISSEFVE